MTIEYDADRKRATHIETGLAIEFDRDGPYPQEREEFFRLHWQGRSYPFKADYDFGTHKIDRLYPDLDIMERRQKRIELNERNYTVTSLPVSVPAAIGATPYFGDVFVAVMHVVVVEMGGTSRKSVYLRPSGYNREWSAEG
jgi:hypothetical protein